MGKPPIAKRPYPTDPWQEHPGLCNSRKTDGSGLCRRGAGQGTEHSGIGQCSKHGGKTPSANAHARNVQSARNVQELIDEHLAGVDYVDPVHAVLEIVRRTWARVRVLEMRYGQLLDRPTGAGEALYDANHLGDDAPHPIVTLLDRATAAHLHACKVAIGAGIEERRLRIVEQNMAALGMVLRAVLVELGQWELPGTPELVERHLRAVDDLGETG